MRASLLVWLALAACTREADLLLLEPTTPFDLGPGTGTRADGGPVDEGSWDVDVPGSEGDAGGLPEPPEGDGSVGLDVGRPDGGMVRDGGPGGDGGRDGGGGPDVDPCPPIEEWVLATDADPAAPPRVGLRFGRATALWRNELGLHLAVVEPDGVISARHSLGHPEAIDPALHVRPLETQLLWIDPAPDGPFLVDHHLGGAEGRVSLDAAGPLRLATTIEGNGAVLAVALGALTGVEVRLQGAAVLQSPLSLPFAAAPQILGETPPLSVIQSNLGPLLGWVSISSLHLRVVVPPDLPTLGEQDPPVQPNDGSLIPTVNLSSRPYVTFGSVTTAQTAVIALPDPAGVEVRHWDFRINETDHSVSRFLRSSPDHFSTAVVWAQELDHTLVAASEAEPGADVNRRRISLWGLDPSGDLAPVDLPPRFLSQAPVGTDARFPGMAWHDGELALVYVTDAQEVRLIRAAACALAGP